jgi:Tail tubular protein
MTLLEAVNLSLRSTGETGVTTINSAHPRISTILAEIDEALRTTQSRGWWFNTFTQDLVPSADPGEGGKVKLDSSIVYAKPQRAYLDYFVLNGYLWDRGTNTAVVDETVTCDVRVRYVQADWAKLPESFQDFVATKAALVFASNYDADQLQIAKVTKMAGEARALVNMEHTRYAKVNLFQSGSAGQAINQAWGNRYPVRR